MKLWFDEDLSPTLVQIANTLGFHATCNRDRGALGHKDPELRRLVQAEGYVFVTDNASDFRPMYERTGIHPGLLVMPAEYGRATQQHLARDAISFIVDQSVAARETPADFMVNTLVEIDDHGRCTTQDLPPQ